MRFILISLLLVFTASCAQNVLHKKDCKVQKSGYLHCKHHVEYETEPVANGSSLKKYK